MIILSIINSLGIIFLIFKLNVIKIGILANRTFWDKTLISYSVYFKSKFWFRIPIRNKRKTVLKEDIHQLLKKPNGTKQNTLSAMFSWKKTLKEVEQFEKDYSIVNKELVQELVNDWKNKNL